MEKFARSITESSLFSNFVLIAILAAGVLVGMQTYPSLVENYGSTLHLIDQIILWIFVVEIVIKVVAEGKKPHYFFKDPWNVFDFIIVAVCFMPLDAQYVAILRLARILRVLRLVTALPKLQVLVGALINSLSSIAYVSILLFLLFYLYAVFGTFMFSVNDPVHFGTLQRAMLSLVRIVTLEDWTDIMYINMFGCADYGYGDHPQLCVNSIASPYLSPAYFISFVLIGTMVVLNLFIGVIMSSMTEMKEENDLLEQRENRKKQGYLTLADEFKYLNTQIASLNNHMKIVDQHVQELQKKS